MSDDGLLPATQNRVATVECDVGLMTKKLDTLGSPLWKRLWWRMDGFKPWYIVERRRKRRPWHPSSQGRRSTDIA